jgi:hypothetical protein
LADWYVYRQDSEPLGPWSTEDVAQAILDGTLAPDVWVAAPGGPRWLRALDVPFIARLVDGVPTKPRRDSGLRIVPGAFNKEPNQGPDYASTVMMVKDEEVIASSEAPTVLKREPSVRDVAADPYADVPPTDRSLPPSPSTPDPPRPVGGGDTLESVAERPKRKASAR